jgi:hypothetical protein
MAVRADDLALGHLVEDCLPSAPRERLPDVERLVAQVIELQHGIGLAAISARMRNEEGKACRTSSAVKVPAAPGERFRGLGLAASVALPGFLGIL